MDAPLEMVAVTGDGAFGKAGSQVQLVAMVRRVSDGVPRADVEVRWSVQSGDGSVGPGGWTAVSDSSGVVFAVLTLGSTPGAVEVAAAAVEHPEAAVVFEAVVVEAPRLTGLSASVAEPGATLTLEGADFFPDASRNVVLFSGIRGSVRAGSATHLEVVVPDCLPTADVEVQVVLGELTSAPLPLRVSGASTGASALDAGDYLDVPEPDAPGCLRLEGGTTRPYLVVTGVTGTVAAARYSTLLRGLSVPESGAAGRAPTSGAVNRSSGAGSAGPGHWEAGLRAWEDALVRAGPPRPTPLSTVAPAATVPAVGDRRTFKVLNAQRTFDEVTAVVRRVSRRAVFYIDESAPGGGYSDSELETLAAYFDEAIHPTVTGAFGQESDLDGNDRVVVLFTPTVNRLTPRGSDGFVGGFFFGLDLLAGREGSNRGEIFYSLVPDPAGTLSDPRPVARLMEAVPAVLAHEFQHMVHFNQRVLRLSAPTNEALWLSEGLAQMAEELVARFYEDRDAGTTELFRRGNQDRAGRYLADPGAVSLLVGLGQGSLEERGAGWLFTLYLADRFGADVLGRLIATTRTGVSNVEAVTGAAFEETLMDWWSALYLDGLGGTYLGRPYAFEYPTVRLRTLLGPYYRLAPVTVGPESFARERSLWSAAAAHYILRTPNQGSTTLRWSGASGGEAPPRSELRMRIVRLR